MLYAIIKALLSGAIISVVSEIARRSPAFGALVASLPIVSVLGMIWLWRDTHDNEKIAAHAEATFWMVLPSLPMFLVLPALLRHGLGFYPALAVSCVLTVILYAVMVFILRKLGVPF